MSTVLSWQRRLRRVRTACVGKWEQSYLIAKAELLVVGITVPTLGVLAVLLGDAHGVSVLWSQAAATILGLVLVSPFMLREMRYSTPTETAATPCILLMNPAEAVTSFSEGPGYEGSFGQMANFSSDELEFLSELVGEYLEGNDDLNHTEFGFAKGVLDKIEESLDA
jgi:hypothetical protein